MPLAVIVAALLALLCPESARAQAPALPREIVAILDRDHHGWALVDNFAVLREPVVATQNLDTSRSHPNFVWGDFDGDGRQDYAVYVTVPGALGRERLLVAFLRREASFRSHVLARGTTLADYIWVAKKGTRYYDHGTERYFRLTHDAIDAVTIEKSATTYVYERGTFRAVTTAD